MLQYIGYLAASGSRPPAVTESAAELFIKSEGDIAPAALKCPISHNLMSNPVRTALGQAYEYESISEWLQSSDRDPSTNEPLSSTILVPDLTGRTAYDEFKASVLAAHPDASRLFAGDHVANRRATDELVRKNAQTSAPATMVMPLRQEPPRPHTVTRYGTACADGAEWLAARLGGYLTCLVLCPLGCACVPLLGLNVNTCCYRQRCDSITCILLGVACGSCCETNVNIDAKWNFAVGPFND